MYIKGLRLACSSSPSLYTVNNTIACAKQECLPTITCSISFIRTFERAAAKFEMSSFCAAFGYKRQHILWFVLRAIIRLGFEPRMREATLFKVRTQFRTSPGDEFLSDFLGLYGTTYDGKEGNTVCTTSSFANACIFTGK